MAIAHPGIGQQRAGESFVKPLGGAAGCVLDGHVAVQVIESQAVIERPPLDRPLILRIEPELPGALLFKIRRRSLGDTERRAVSKRITRVSVRCKKVIREQLFPLDPGFEGMRPRDVGHREPLGKAVRVIGETAVGGHRAISDTEPNVIDGDGVAQHPWRKERIPLGNRCAHASFEQQAACQRRVPSDLLEHVGFEPIAPAGSFLREGGRSRVTVASMEKHATQLDHSARATVVLHHNADCAQGNVVSASSISAQQSTRR